MHFENGKADPPNATDPNPSEIPPENLLESPSQQLILLRKQLLVEKLLKKKSKSKTTTSSDEVPGTGSAPIRKTLKMGPSSVLSRVKDFLPVMKTENEKLLLQAAENPASVSLEVNGEDDKVGEDLGQPMVELNLALMPQTDNEESDSSSDAGDENEVNLLNHGQQKSLKDDNKHIFFREDEASISVDGESSDKKEVRNKLIEDVTPEGRMNQES